MKCRGLCFDYIIPLLQTMVNNGMIWQTMVNNGMKCREILEFDYSIVVISMVRTYHWHIIPLDPNIWEGTANPPKPYPKHVLRSYNWIQEGRLKSMYVYIYIYIHTNINMCMHMYIVYIFKYAYMYLYMYLYMYI